MIRDKYAYMGLKEGMRVLVYTVPLEGEPATIQTINQYGNLLVMYDRTIPGDEYDDDPQPYSGQMVHPRQVEILE